MRERLIAALVGVTVSVIALYGIPRAYVLADLVETHELRTAERSVELVALLLAERGGHGEPVTAGYLTGLLGQAEHLEYVAPDGSRTSTGRRPAAHEHDLVLSRALPGGGELTLTRSGRLVGQRISDALLPLVLAGLALMTVAVAVGFTLARRLSRPFTELAGTAEQLGHGRFDLEVPHYAVPEAERIGQALRASSRRLAELVQRERELAVNASHQLRTPITALRLELEDLALWPETPPAVSSHLSASIVELDRLNTAITDQLDLARGHRFGDAAHVDLSRLAGDAVRRWEERFDREGRSLVRTGASGVTAHVPPAALLELLDALLEHAAEQGEGTVTVEVADVGTHLQVRVADEGGRSVDPELLRVGADPGSGERVRVGLAVAAELAGAIGGHLSVDDTRPNRWVLRLPHAAET